MIIKAVAMRAVKINKTRMRRQKGHSFTLFLAMIIESPYYEKKTANW
jgi:hypothetical protein